MSSSRLIRPSGLALLLAGLLVAIPILFHPSDADPQAVLNSIWVPVHSLFVSGAVLMLFGLIGFYASQIERTGGLGLIGFILTFIGNALIVFVLALEAFVIPVIAANAAGQALLDPAGPLFGGLLGLVLLLMAGSFALGTILIRHRDLPRRGAATLGRRPARRRWATTGLLAATASTAWHDRRSAGRGELRMVRVHDLGRVRRSRTPAGDA